MEPVALKAATVLPILFLQKTKQKVKSERAHPASGETTYKLVQLLNEGRALQQRLPNDQTHQANFNLAHLFSNLMFAGKCKVALDVVGCSIQCPKGRASTPEQSC